MKHFVLPMMLIGFAGCSNTAGGPCEYQSINGIATIVVNDENTTTAQFQPESNAQKSPWLREGDLFYLHQHVDGQTGSQYPATMHVIIEGTCTPLQLEITGHEVLDSHKNGMEKKPDLV